MRRLFPILLLAACGTEGGEDGGGANLPNRGIAGWERLAPDDAKFVVPSPAGEAFADPSALVVGDEVVVYATRTGTADTIVRMSSVDGISFDAPTVALEQALHPSVIAKPGGFWMAFDNDGVGLAESVDGVTFTRVDAKLADVSEPSLVLDGDTLVVFAVTPAGAIVRSDVTGLVFGEPEIVLAPIADCTNAFGETEACWDGTALGGPDVRLATNANGRKVWRMWLTGRQGATTDLGFAASYDGHTWSRYVFNPVIEESASQLGPSSIVFGDDYFLYWSEFGAESGIAAARISPTAERGTPTERW